MDLKTLLNNNNWEQSDLSYANADLLKEIAQKTKKPIQKVLENSKKAIVLNSIILLCFLFFYLFFPNPITTLATLIIAAVYLFTIGSLVYGLSTLEKPNLNQNIKKALEDIIAYDKKMYAFQCNNVSLIITASFIGGFLLGLGFQGFTLEKILDKWEVLVILGLGTIGMYYWSKTKSFRAFNRSFNPTYFKSKSFIKEQLEILNS